MKEHESLRQLLPLAAAGVLGEEEQLRVERHARECDNCRHGLETWRALSRDLRRLPQPVVPARLVELTRVRVLQERTVAETRHQDELLLVCLALFSGISSSAVWYLLRLLFGSGLSVLGVDILSWTTWLAGSTVLVWASAAAAAVALGNRHRELRRALL
jgi:hypothetical protein